MAANVSDLAERVTKEMHLHNHDQASSSARGRSHSLPLCSPHSFMNDSLPLPASRALQDHAEEVATCETSLPGRLSPGAEYIKAIGNVRLIPHQRVMSEESTGWTDPWDYPINPIYDTVTGNLIGAADIPRKVPYWLADSEISEGSIQKKDNDPWSSMAHSNTHSGNQSGVDTEALDPLGIPKAHHWQPERLVILLMLILVFFLFFWSTLMLIVFPISPALNLLLDCRTHRLTKRVVIFRLSLGMNMMLQVGRIIGSAGRSLCLLWWLLPTDKQT